MAQRKAKKNKVKVHDLKPKKDAKGGAGPQRGPQQGPQFGPQTSGQ